MTFSKSCQTSNLHFLHEKKPNPIQLPENKLLQGFLPDPAPTALAHRDGMSWKHRGVQQCQASLFISVLQILTPARGHARGAGRPGPSPALLVTISSRWTFLHEAFPGLLSANKPD